MTLVKRFMAGLVLAVGAASAQAGPFGFDMGETLENLKSKVELQKVSEYVYVTFEAPKPYPGMEGYRLLVTPEHGLCKIGAVTKDIKSASHGDEMISAFNRIEAGLTSRYGAGDRLDFLNAGSSWTAPNNWMMGLLRNERSLVSYWGGKGKAFGENLSIISLEAKASNLHAGFITVSYEFTNAEACLDWVAARENESL